MRLNYIVILCLAGLSIQCGKNSNTLPEQQPKQQVNALPEQQLASYIDSSLPATTKIQKKQQPISIKNKSRATIQNTSNQGIPLLNLRAAGLTKRDKMQFCKVLDNANICLDEAKWYFKGKRCGDNLVAGSKILVNKIKASSASKAESPSKKLSNECKRDIKLCSIFSYSCLENAAYKCVKTMQIHAGC